MFKARDRAIEQIKQLYAYLEHEPTFLDGVEQLKDIQTAINEAYQSHNIVRVK